MPAHAVRVLRARVEREAVLGRVVVADRRARLHGVGCDAVVVEAHRNLVLRFRKRRVGRVLVPHHERESEVAGGVVVPHLGRAVLGGVFHVHHRAQRLVVHFHALGGDARLLGSVRDDERDAVSDVARLGRLEQRPEGAVALRPAHVLGHEERRNAAQLFPLCILSRQHGHHAGRLEGGLSIDRTDSRVRMRRHDHRAVQHVRQLDVVHEARAAGEEARVLDPAYGLAYSEAVHPVSLRVLTSPAQALELRPGAARHPLRSAAARDPARPASS